MIIIESLKKGLQKLKNLFIISLTRRYKSTAISIY